MALSSSEVEAESLSENGHEANGARRAPSDRATSSGAAPRPDAILNGRELSSTRKEPRKDPRKGIRPDPGSLSPADRELIQSLVRLRFLSYPQIERRHFPERSLQAVGQRVKRLAATGWVTTWKRPVKAGGRPRFVLPTAEAFRWAFSEIRQRASGSPLEKLIGFMLPQRPRQALTLDPVNEPPFVAHQTECNELVLALETRGPAKILWASTWERPFPNQVRGLAMPQPDAVLVLESEGGPRLVFLEHDRGMESLVHFRSAKVERYAELSVWPDVCEELLGWRTFEVWVSVLDRRFHRPLARLAALSRVATLAGAEELMRFALAGRMHESPGGQIWFLDSAVPDVDSGRSNNENDGVDARTKGVL